MKYSTRTRLVIKDNRIKREFVLAHAVIVLLSISLIVMTMIISLDIPVDSSQIDYLSGFLITLLAVVIVISTAMIIAVVTAKRK